MRARGARVGLLAALALAWPSWGDPLPAQAPSSRDTATDTAAARPGVHARRAAAKAEHRYDDIFRRYSKRYFGPAFDWRWFKAQGMAESGLDSAARSPVGARGVMQLMPATYGLIRSRRPEFGAIDDPEWNIAAGIMHDRYLFRLWEGRAAAEERRRFMFASYNAGERTIQRAADTARVAAAAPADALRWVHVEEVAPRVPRWRYRETLGYVRRIDGFYDRMRRRR